MTVGVTAEDDVGAEAEGVDGQSLLPKRSEISTNRSAPFVGRATARSGRSILQAPFYCLYAQISCAAVTNHINISLCVDGEGYG
jgi:hypothetical protein